MAPRLHRLPQRLDYTLIPAPLDLSLPEVTEKSDLPAIIVTPSSPRTSHDFSIAFLAPPPKPSFSSRLSSSLSSLKARTFFLLSLLFFILVCHLLMHRMASHSEPFLQFASDQSSVSVQREGGSLSTPVDEWFAGLSQWFSSHSGGGMGGGMGDEMDLKRDFIVYKGQTIS